MELPEDQAVELTFRGAEHRHQLLVLEIETCRTALSLGSAQATYGLLESARNQTRLIASFAVAAAETTGSIKDLDARKVFETQLSEIRSQLTHSKNS